MTPKPPKKRPAGLGNDLALLRKLIALIKPAASRSVPIGDDCAIIPDGKNFLLLTTDILVEGNHFTTDYMAPRQIGKKAIEVNVSDIAACGGLPRYAVISLVLPRHTAPAFLKDLYTGITRACRRYGIKIIGGDTARGRFIAINVALLGRVERTHLCRRSGARIGDLILVTGPLGESAAALALLRAHSAPRQSTSSYTEPRAQLARARTIAPYCNAMIDSSDGIASEIRHICLQSGTGARIRQEKIPISRVTWRIAALLGRNPYGWVLRGGEDFQLVAAVSPGVYRRHRRLFRGCTIIGEIRPKNEGIRLIDRRSGRERRRPLGFGYRHFPGAQGKVTPKK